MHHLQPGSTLRVLCYHRLEDPARPRDDLAADLISATPQLFEEHLRHLARCYQPIGAAEVLSGLEHRTLPRGAVLVTFDDAYRDFAELAWPLLRKYGVPVVLFVPTAFVDNPDRVFWWDSLWQILTRTPAVRITLPKSGPAALLSESDRKIAFLELAAWLKACPPAKRSATLDELSRQLAVEPAPTRSVLSWPELRSLQQDGVTVAAHGHTHELLDQLDEAGVRREVQRCRDGLVSELGTCAPLFAYPNGNVDVVAAHEVKAAGFRLGFTTVHGWNQLRTLDPYLLRRDGGRASRSRLIVKLLGPVEAIQTLRHRLPSEPVAAYGDRASS